MGLGCRGAIYQIPTINIPTEDLEVHAMLSSPLFLPGEWTLLSQLWNTVHLRSVRCTNPPVTDIPTLFRARQGLVAPREGGFWKWLKKKKGVYHMVLLPLCQLPVHHIPKGDHELEHSGPCSWSSSAENSNFKRRLPRKHMRCVCVCV